MPLVPKKHPALQTNDEEQQKQSETQFYFQRESSPYGSAGGDLEGSYPNPGVAKIRGSGVGSTPPSTDDTLVFDGLIWVPSKLAPTGIAGGGATTGQLLRWDGSAWTPSDGYTDEEARDAIGSALVDSDTVEWVVNDAGDTISAEVSDGSLGPEKFNGSGGSEGDVPTVQSDGTIALQAPSARPQLMTFHGGNTVAPPAGARYFTAGASSGFATSTSAVRRAKFPMRISDLAVRITSDMPANDWAAIDLIVNGFATNFITLAAGATAGIYQTTGGEHFDLSAGDDWYWRLFKSDASSSGEDSAPIGPGDFLIKPL